MEIFVELVLEVLLVLIFEGGFVAGIRKALGYADDESGDGSPRKRKQFGPVLSTALYVGMGAFLGWVSLFIKAEHMLQDPMASYINLALSPLIAGLCMMAFGAWRKKQGLRLMHIDKFFYGYIFALAFSLMRFLFAYDGLVG